MAAQAPGYMVQGFFFQEGESLGIAMKPIEGAVAVIRRGMARSMFSGLIWQDDFLDELTGEMSDPFGSSALEDVTLTDSEFTFVKKYERRTDSIFYRFHPEGDFWVGKYTGERVGRGNANCILTPVSMQMLYSM